MLDSWGTPLAEELMPDLAALADRLASANSLHDELRELLTEEEVGMLRQRTEAALDEPFFPQIDPSRNIPWPLE